jgi:chromosome segregation ATPase
LTLPRNQNAPQMNSKVPVVVLLVLCVGLLAALVLRHNRAVTQQRADADRIRQLSDEWKNTSARLDEQVSVNSTLTNTYAATKADLERTSNLLAETKEQLTTTEKAVQTARQVVADQQAELAKNEKRIAELENQNSTLDKQAADMKLAITGLEGRIGDTQKKLASAEGDREYLLKELARLQAEKAEMERRLNDVVALKDQIRKLKEELSVSRKLEAIRRTIYGSDPKKGAELLQQRSSGAGQPDLNVEVRRDGSATIVAPTNAPPANK